MDSLVKMVISLNNGELHFSRSRAKQKTIANAPGYGEYYSGTK